VSAERAIVLCGHAKSGTTLVQSLLDGHPALVVIPEETKYFAQIDRWPLRRRASYVLRRSRVARLTPGVAGIYDYSHLDRALFARALASDLGAWPPARRILPAIARAYAAASALDGASARAWVEKTPGNEHHLERALRLWPALRAVYVVRDPRDVFVSFRAKRAKRSKQLAVDRFCGRWSASLAAWDAFVADHTERALALVFEHVIESPETELRRLTKFLGIEWCASLLEPTIAGRPFEGNSMHGDRFTAISRAPRRRHASLLEPELARAIERRLAPAFERFGWDS